jgi:NAD(P)-dependent dehydrogenase (short-subunit alcohol dehydrogenase family)
MATILITGTNKGVGLELTKIYAARGDTVYAACRDPAGASALAEVLGEVVILPLVVGDSGSVTAMAEQPGWGDH